MSSQERPEDVLAALRGTQPGTAWQLRSGSDKNQDGVVLEQMAYSAALGWYVQRSIALPAEIMAPLARELHKAACLRGAGGSECTTTGCAGAGCPASYVSENPIPFPGATPPLPPPKPQERKA